MKSRKIPGTHEIEHYCPELLSWEPKDKSWRGFWGYFTINQLVTHPESVVTTSDQLRTRIKLKKFAGKSIYQVMTTPIEKKTQDYTEFDNFLKVLLMFGTTTEKSRIQSS